MSTSPITSLHITPIRATDFDEWARLFWKYIDFHESALPDSQYRQTFDRLVRADRDLYGFVLSSREKESKLYGIAHFYPHQTPWSEMQIMHLNDVYIDPSVRGRGYGRDLIEAVADKATEMGCLRFAVGVAAREPGEEAVRSDG